MQKMHISYEHSPGRKIIFSNEAEAAIWVPKQTQNHLLGNLTTQSIQMRSVLIEMCQNIPGFMCNYKLKDYSIFLFLF